MPFIENPETGTRWHSCHRELRWSDFDQYQHVNNARYLEFAQDARMDFVRDVVREMNITVPPFFVRHTTIDYPAPIPVGETEVAVSTHITNIGSKSCTIRHEMRDSNSRLACKIDTVMVGMDLKTGKSREWSEEDHKNLALFLMPETSAGAPGTRKSSSEKK